MNTTFENKNNRINPEAHAPLTLSEAVRARISSQIESVKHQVFAEFKEALETNEQLLRLALSEADALARQTGFPQLVFPLLAVEKAQSAARWQYHQRYLLRSNSPYALAA